MTRILSINITGIFQISHAGANEIVEYGKISIALKTSVSILFRVTGGYRQDSTAYLYSRGTALALTHPLV